MNYPALSERGSLREAQLLLQGRYCSCQEGTIKSESIFQCLEPCWYLKIEADSLF